MRTGGSPAPRIVSKEGGDGLIALLVRPAADDNHAVMACLAAVNWSGASSCWRIRGSRPCRDHSGYVVAHSSKPLFVDLRGGRPGGSIWSTV